MSSITKGETPMRDFMKNAGYFLSEVKTIFLLNGFSSLLSVLSLTLIFFVALLAVSGWWISADFVKALQNEAEISVYYSDRLEASAVDRLQSTIQGIDGVQDVTLIQAQESYQRMTDILGQDAKVLTYFDENPFEPYLEIGIELDKLESILKAVGRIPEAEYVRDNQTVLEKLSAIANIVTVLGIVIALAVSASTFIITSHIIREGVHSHRDQINTLKLLGAPDWFVNSPFIIEGALLTAVAGGLASALFAVFMIRVQELAAASVTFMPAVKPEMILPALVTGMMLSSIAMGIAASLFGLKMVRLK